MIRNVIFDWSGTLVDDLPAVWQATNAVFRKAGVAEMALDRFRAEFCLPFLRFYERFVPQVPLTQLETWFHEAYRDVEDNVVELPHARAFLETCRARGLRCFVLSSVHQSHFATQSERTGLAGFFERPYVEVWDKRTRIKELLTENALTPEETLFVGDMQHDIDTAHTGGVRSAAVLTGYNRLDQLRASNPDVIVEHLGELGRLLETQGWGLAPGGVSSPSAALLPVATVGALIYRDGGQVLMVRTQKWSDRWGIPGGKIKYGESSLDALRREIREETNLQIQDIEFVLVQDCLRSTEFYREAHFILLNYACRVAGTDAVRLNEEAREYRWATTSEALALDLNQPTRVLLEALRAREAAASGGDRVGVTDLEVCYCVGVPDAERAQPQRLLLTVEMETDVRDAARGDDLRQTIDYDAVSRRLLALGGGRSWRLIETLAEDIARIVLAEFRPSAVTVTVKKFIIAAARHVSVRVRRTR